MGSIKFTSTERDDSTVRISDGMESVWTSSVAATAGHIQAIADAYLDGYDGEGQVEFTIYALDDEDGVVLAKCLGESGCAASCEC